MWCSHDSALIKISIPPPSSSSSSLSPLWIREKNSSDTLGQRIRIRKPKCRDHVGNEERIRSSQRHSHQSVRPPPLALQMKGLMISNVDKVDQTMDSIREQMDLTNEISDAISNPVGMGNQVDEVGQVHALFVIEYDTC